MTLPITTSVVSSLSGFRPTDVTPLTTAFTLPLRCTDRWFHTSGFQSVQVTTVRSGVWHLDPLYTNCLAANATTAVYFPGRCPNGETMASITEYMTLPESADGSHRLWHAFCCPMGMVLSSSSCYSFFTTPIVAFVYLTFEYTTISGSIPVTGTTVAFVRTVTVQPNVRGPPQTDTIMNSVTVTGGEMWANPVEVYWRVADLKSFGSEYATSLAQNFGMQVPATTTTEKPTTSATASQGTQPTSPGLSPEKKAGISVGTIFGVALVALGLFFYIKRYRKRRETGVAAGQPETAENETGAQEMEEQNQQYIGQKHFVAGKWRSEADARTNPVEMDVDVATDHATTAPHMELDGRNLQERERR